MRLDKDQGAFLKKHGFSNPNAVALGDPAYPLKLFQRLITVSLETMRVVRSLPKLEIA